MPEWKKVLHFFRKKIVTYSYKGFAVGKYPLKERRFFITDLSNWEKGLNHHIDFVFGMNAIIAIWGDWLFNKDGGYIGFIKVPMKINS